MKLFNKPQAAATTVDGIMSAFNQTISDLEAVEQANTEAAKQKSEAAAQLVTEANAATAEAKRANTIAGKLRSIVQA